MNAETKNCQNCKQNFAIESEDFDFYAKIQVPPPTWCPECRMVRRMLFRNIRFLYKRKCCVSGKMLFSSFHPKVPISVYDHSDPLVRDKIDSLIYGRDYAPSKPFLNQLKELSRAVPWPSIPSTDYLVNSPYCTGGWLKNCYLCFNAGYDENCAYSVTLANSKECYNVDYSSYAELCAESINVYQCYKTFFSADCSACREVWLSRDLKNCNNCFGCAGLRNRQYCIFNKQYTKEEYEKFLKESKINSYNAFAELQKKAQAVWLSRPVRFADQVSVQNVSGDYIYNSSNIKQSFFANNAKDCAFSQLIFYGPIKDSYDTTYVGINADLVYETDEAGINVSSLKFCWNIFPDSYDLQYCMDCQNCSHCFGCVGLRNKQYCILNKQYTKEDYEKLALSIIEQMSVVPYIDSRGRVYKYGEFFPPEFSFHAYNESTAWEFFPISRKEAEKKGYSWADAEPRDLSHDLTAKDIPEDQNLVRDKIILCADEGRCDHQCFERYRFIPQELAFYKAMNLPLPRKCFSCRHSERMRLINPFRLQKRRCMCRGVSGQSYTNTSTHFHDTRACPNEFETSYAPDRPEIVYCEQCYQSEVV